MAAVDYYLKLDGIKGESTDDKHKEEIDVLSFSLSEEQVGANAAVGAGAGAGKVQVDDFRFVALTSKASPALFEACATGAHIKEGYFYARKAGGSQQDYITIKLEQILVSSYKIGGLDSSTKAGDGSVLPTDEVSLNFAKISYEYKEQKPDGTLGGGIKKGYDIQANKKL